MGAGRRCRVRPERLERRVGGPATDAGSRTDRLLTADDASGAGRAGRFSETFSQRPIRRAVHLWHFFPARLMGGTGAVRGR